MRRDRAIIAAVDSAVCSARAAANSVTAAVIDASVSHVFGISEPLRAAVAAARNLRDVRRCRSRGNHGRLGSAHEAVLHQTRVWKGASEQCVPSTTLVTVINLDAQINLDS